MTTFTLPDPGEGISEAKLVEWHVSPGDHVEADSAVASVETDKAVVDIPIPEEATIESLAYDEGDTAVVGEELLTYTEGQTETEDKTTEQSSEDTNGTEPSQETPNESEATQSQDETDQSDSDASTSLSEESTEQSNEDTPGAEPNKETPNESEETPVSEETNQSDSDAATESNEDVKAMPRVRHKARQLDIDLTDVNGTGPRGRILLSDLPETEVEPGETWEEDQTEAPDETDDGETTHGDVERFQPERTQFTGPPRDRSTTAPKPAEDQKDNEGGPERSGEQALQETGDDNTVEHVPSAETDVESVKDEVLSELKDDLADAKNELQDDLRDDLQSTKDDIIDQVKEDVRTQTPDEKTLREDIKNRVRREATTIKDNILSDLRDEVASVKENVEDDIRSDLPTEETIREKAKADVESVKETIESDIQSVKETVENDVESVRDDLTERIDERVEEAKNEARSDDVTENLDAVNDELTTVKNTISEITEDQERLTEDVESLRDTIETTKLEDDAVSPPSPPGQETEPAKLDALSGIRGSIAENMYESLNTTAQTTLTEEADVTKLVTLHEEIKAETDAPITYLSYFVKAASQVLDKHTGFNAHFTDDGVIKRDEHNIGIAVDTSRGLLVPVLDNADKRSIESIAEGIADLADKTRSGDATPDTYKDATFTVSSIGSIAGETFTPIINTPEVAILGVGQIKERPRYHDDSLDKAHVVNLSLTIDHQVIDGADAARFLNDLTTTLSEPTTMMVRG